jgi:uncharacterized membrane protein required for colicin V production
MLGLDALFWIMICLFALIGLNRGWAKEVLVTFSVVLAIFILTVMQTFEPQIIQVLAVNNSSALFWFRSLILVVLVFFGYQTPSLARLAGSGRFARERLQDALLGLFLGGVNGYMVVGTLWYFLHIAQYPFPGVITPPAPESAAAQLIALLPPEWLGVPVIYFAVAVAFAFILVVFL